VAPFKAEISTDDMTALQLLVQQLVRLLVLEISTGDMTALQLLVQQLVRPPITPVHDWEQPPLELPTNDVTSDKTANRTY